MSTIGVLKPAFFRSSSNSRPLLPGITTSERITSNDSVRMSSTARTALSQTVASCPASRNARERDRKSTRLNSSHSQISYAVFCLKKTKIITDVHHFPATDWAERPIEAHPQWLDPAHRSSVASHAPPPLR